MRKYHFEICNTKITFAAENELIFDRDASAFQNKSQNSDIEICCEVKHTLLPEGQLLGKGKLKNAYEHKGSFSRTLIYDNEIYASMKYCPKEMSKAQLLIKDNTWEWATDSYHLWTTAALPTLLLYHRALIFHASYISHNESGILFTAPSGTGKSTQAELWHKCRGATVLNGDKAGVSFRDKLMAHSVPFSGTSGICENVSLPLKAIVVLSKAQENKARRLSPSEAVMALCENLFSDQLIPQEWSMTLQLVLDIVTEIPVYHLACTPDERAVRALEEKLYN